MRPLLRSTGFVLGIGLCLLPAGLAFELFRDLGYAWIALLALAGAWAVRVAIEGAVRQPVRWGPHDLWGAGLGLAILAVFVWRVEFGYKVMMDEAALTGTALGMHLERIPLAVARAYWIEGAFTPVETFIDKRPLLQPFLVATLHDLTGMRIANGFAVSALAAAFALLGVYLLGRRCLGVPGGCLAMGLLGGLPLLWLAGSSGGFDALNLAVLVLSGLLVAAAWQDPETRVFRALLIGLLLTFTVRYESPALAAVVGAGWLVAARANGWWPRLPWNSLAAVPALIAPWCWQLRLAMDAPNAWQLANKGLPADSPVFGPGYLADNLGAAVVFLLSLDPMQPNSRALGLIGLTALVAGAALAVRRLRWPGAGRRAGSAGLGLWLAGLGAIPAVHLLYFWGQYTDEITQRLSLPLHLLFAVLAVVLLATVQQRSWQRIGLLAAGVLAALGWLGETLPELGDPQTWARHQDQQLEEAKRVFIEDRVAQGHRPFVIGRSAVAWINAGVPARTWDGMDQRWNALRFHWEAGTWDAVYLVRHEQRGAGGRWIPEPGMTAPDSVRLTSQPVLTAYATPVKRITIRRVVSLATAEDRFAAFWAGQRGRTDADAVYAEYALLWLSQLP